MNKVLYITGIVLALIGASIMFQGNVFGERTLGVAVIICIVGLALIATNSPWKIKKK